MLVKEMLQPLLGSENSEHVLLFIFSHKEGYAAEAGFI